jgi:hypothetical protein
VRRHLYEVIVAQVVLLRAHLDPLVMGIQKLVRDVAHPPPGSDLGRILDGGQLRYRKHAVLLFGMSP